jgi:hypothetical protein
MRRRSEIIPSPRAAKAGVGYSGAAPVWNRRETRASAFEQSMTVFGLQTPLAKLNADIHIW